MNADEGGKTEDEGNELLSFVHRQSSVRHHFIPRESASNFSFLSIW